MEDEASGEVAAPVRATHGRIHVGRDAPRGQVFPNESLRPVPVEASRGVADAWKMDARCHKRKDENGRMGITHTQEKKSLVSHRGFRWGGGRGGREADCVCVCIYTHM